MTEQEYLEKEKHIWQTLVPATGQAEYVQGELLRALAKLQDEAQRNGNINWDSGHEILAFYILTTVKDAQFLGDKKYKQLEDDIALLWIFVRPILMMIYIQELHI